MKHLLMLRQYLNQYFNNLYIENRIEIDSINLNEIDTSYYRLNPFVDHPSAKHALYVMKDILKHKNISKDLCKAYLKINDIVSSNN